MRYSGAVVRWAQSSLAAPFSFAIPGIAAAERVIQTLTQLSAFS
jgi:hypothetical protein